ncbi:MAG: precorrin-6Y C5,15-methyltransferase (decarboxylating) subunit CbiT, partial [Spirochaetia bacterium]|nr:precorrin-6Y C5,15-methyltransferase (decarboxylating) subunit CbiT [Spirochaetia bacterium]
AEKMLCYGETSWEAWLCENLSGPGEKVTEFSKIENLARLAEYSPLNVLIIRRTDPSWKPIPMFNHFSEDQYAKRMPSKGLITKKEVRMFSIAQLALRNDSVIWDIGAASGSVAIECAMAADRGHAYAVEMNHESIAHCRENLLNFAVDNVTVIEGKAPEILSEIPEDPDAVFVGGSSGSLSEIINTVFVRLKVSGRMVVNAVTIENIHEAHETFKKMSLVPEITMLNLSRCIPLARFMRYEALNPIHIFCITKKEEKIK